MFQYKLIYGQTSWTTYPADLPMHDSLKVQQLDIPKTDYAFYYRLLLNGQTIDIYSQDKTVFNGEITNSIKEYKYVKIDNDYRSQATQLYSEKVEIDSSLATSIALQLIKSEQQSIPTDTLIDSWTKWYLHCGNLNFEIKNEGNYVKQSFHCPWSQPDYVEFKDVILSNYKLLQKELKLDSIYREFMSQLPKGKTYSRSGYGMTYIMTDKQEEDWENDRPRRDYLKSIRDTIDSYLRTELEKQKIELKDINCFEDYRLTFNEDGKLWKLKLSEYNKPKLFDDFWFYLEDKKEIRKCKNLIRQVFREIDLSSFNLKYKVYRTLSFGLEGEVRLRDNTIY